MRVEAIVLAAGESTRMGRSKQLLPWGDSTILETILRVLQKSAVGGITVVLGHSRREIEASIGHLSLNIVVNPRPELGMLSSIQCALESIRGDAEAYLIALGDQPQIQASTVDSLIRAASESDQGIYLPTFSGKRGHPVVLRARNRSAILGLSPESGLNILIRANGADVCELPVPSPTILADIDTPGDYERAREQM